MTNYLDNFTYLSNKQAGKVGNSIIYRLDSRIKFLFSLFFIFFVVFTPPSYFIKFLFYFIFILIIVITSNIPLLYILKRSLVIIPFVLLIGIFIPFLKNGEIAGSYNFRLFKVTVTYEGLVIFWNIFIKAFLSALALIILSATTQFNSLLEGLKKLRIPFIFIMILSLMYRYLFIIQEKLILIDRARKLRSFKGKKRSIFLSQTRVLGNIIATLFIKSYNQGEQIYTSMCLRGFTGNTKTLDRLKIRGYDILFLSLSLVCMVVIRFIIK